MDCPTVTCLYLVFLTNDFFFFFNYTAYYALLVILVSSMAINLRAVDTQVHISDHETEYISVPEIYSTIISTLFVCQTF